MTDAVLFNKWRSERDAEAFRELASRYSGMVYATCLRVLRNPQEAEEAAQECFEKLAGAPRIASPYLGPWLHKVATNGAVDRLRREGRRRAREDRYAVERGAGHTPEWDDIYPLVDEAIAELPEELRVPLVSHFIENRTHESIAQELGVPRPTVSYRIQRALERVRQSLKRRGVEVASAAFATLFAEKMAEAAVAPAALEAALGRLAMAGLKAAPLTVGGILGLLGGTAAKVLLGVTAVAVVVAGVAWHTFAPREPSPTPMRQVEATQPTVAKTTIPASKAVVTEPNPAPVAAAAVSPQDVSESGVITGRVYDAKTNLGVAGMEVYSDGTDIQKTAESGDDGIYRITGLADGVYRVRPGGDVPGYSGRGFRIIQVTVDGMKPAEGVDFALEPGIPVSGRVITANGQPVPGANVGAKVDTQSGAAHAKSDADGTFRVDMPNPGNGLQMQAKGGGFQTPIVLRDSLGPEGLGGVELVLTEPLTAGMEGKLLLSNGSPAADYSLHLDNAGSEYLVGIPDGHTGADGSFKIDKLAAGTYTVVFGRPGRDGWSSQDEVGQVTVAAGQTLKGVVLQIGADKQGLSITGRVVDVAGKGVEGVTVSANREGVGIQTITDNSGDFELMGLAEGRFFVRAATLTRGDLEDPPHSPAMLADVEAGTRGLKIVVEGVGRIEGRAVDARGGSPLPRFETYLYGGNHPEMRPQLLMNGQSVNNPEGRFAIEQIDRGPQTVIVKAQGFAPMLQVVEVMPDQTVTCADFRLEPTTQLTGTVVDEEGKPIADVGIFFCSEMQGFELERPLVRTGPDGTFSLDLLTPQITEVVAYHPNYPPTKAGIEQLSAIVLRKGGAVEGRVTVSGQPVEGCQIVVVSPMRGFGRAVSKSDGSYRLEGLPARTVGVEAHLQGNRNSLQQVEVEAGGTSTLDFDFSTLDAGVEGTVTLSGKPVENAILAVFIEGNAGTEGKHAKTDAAGHYAFESLPSGTVRLTFMGIMNEQGNGLSDQPTSLRRVNLELTPGTTAHQDFEIAGPGTIVGKVAGLSSEWTGMAILFPSTSVIPQELDQAAFSELMMRDVLGSAMCNPDGTFQIGLLPPGDYIVLAVLLPKNNPPSFGDALTDRAQVKVGDETVTVNLAPR